METVLPRDRYQGKYLYNVHRQSLLPKKSSAADHSLPRSWCPFFPFILHVNSKMTLYCEQWKDHK